MKTNVQPPSLATLRDLCGSRLPNDGASSDEKQIRPGHESKVYGRSVQDRWIYRATKLTLKKEFLPASEITVDKRPLLDLLNQRNVLIEQICARAALGDEQAISLMISTAEGVIAALDSIEQFQPRKLQEAAEASSTWPVLLRLNQQDIEHAKERLRRLRVGTKSTTPPRPLQKLDPQNFWTRLAEGAIKACEDNRAIVPALKNAASGLIGKRRSLKFWKKQAKGTLYFLSDRDCIIIMDWEKQCVKLSEPITKANFKQWWKAVQFCVLELWKTSDEDYQAALAKISGRTAPKEFQKRNLAMSQVRKALRSLVGLR